MLTGPLGSPTVSLIVVTHNSASDVQDLISSIDRAMSDQAYEIILIDSGSTDESAALSAALAAGSDRADLGPIVAYQSVDNVGFGTAANMGAANARGTVLVFVNPDARLITSLKPAVELALSADVGAVGAIIVDGDRSQPACGRFPTAWRVFPRSLQRRNPSKPSDRVVDWVEGSLMVLEARKFRALGGFDEGFFMYVEDVELCFRLSRSGWSSRVCWDVAYLHAGGYSPARRWLVREGLDRFFVLHRGPAARLVRRVASALGSWRARREAI